MHMPDGRSAERPTRINGPLVPPEFMKRQGARPTDGAVEARRAAPQTMEEVSARWTELQNKRGHSGLSLDEEKEVEKLEASMHRMRASGRSIEGGMSQAV